MVARHTFNHRHTETDWTDWSITKAHQEQLCKIAPECGLEKVEEWDSCGKDDRDTESAHLAASISLNLGNIVASAETQKELAQVDYLTSGVCMVNLNLKNSLQLLHMDPQSNSHVKNPLGSIMCSESRASGAIKPYFCMFSFAHPLIPCPTICCAALAEVAEAKKSQWINPTAQTFLSEKRMVARIPLFKMKWSLHH